MSEQDMRADDEDGLTLGNRTGADRLATMFQRRRRGVLVTSAAVLALGLSIGGATVAGAGTTTTPPSSSNSSGARPPTGGMGGKSGPGGSPPAAVGTVASLGDGTFTLTTKDATRVTVDVSSSTTYKDATVTDPTIADVTVGAHVAVFGKETSDVVAATSVAIGEPPGGGKGGQGGRGGPGGPGGTGGPGKGGALPPGAGGSARSGTSSTSG